MASGGDDSERDRELAERTLRLHENDPGFARLVATSAPRLNRLLARANAVFKLRLGALLAIPGTPLLFLHSPVFRTAGTVAVCLGVPAVLLGLVQYLRARDP